MPTAYVQSKALSASASSTTIAVTLDASVGSGNAIVGLVCWGSATESDLASVTDDQGNTYTLVRFVPDTNNSQSIKGFYLANITNAPITITANFSPARPYRSISLHEVSGVATSGLLDQDAGQLQTAPGTGPDGVTSGSVITTANGEYIFGGCADTAALRALSQYAGGTGYTRRQEVGSTSVINMASEDQIQASAGAIAATFTATNNDRTVSLILTLKAAAAGGGGVAQTPNRNIQINYGGTFAGAGRGVFGRVRRPRGRWGSLRAARVIDSPRINRGRGNGKGGAAISGETHQRLFLIRQNIKRLNKHQAVLTEVKHG